MRKKLLKLYLLFVIPAVLIILILYGLNQFVGNMVISIGSNILSFVFIFLAFLTSFIAPLWYRMGFIKKWKSFGEEEKKNSDIYGFEKNSLIITLCTPYIMIIAYVLGIDRIPMIVIVLAALYSAYYYYPSLSRIKLEERIFQIK